MTWEEANLSLQLAAEERVGALMRAAAAQARKQEDDAFEAAKGAMHGPG